MNTNQDTTLTNQDVMIDIKPLKQADIVQIIRTAESLDDAVNKMNGLAANGWLTLWDNATHPDGTSYRDLPAWKEATKASVELVDELKAATKASEKRIQELEAEVMKAQSYFMKSQRELRELQSHVNQLREALTHADEFIRNGIEFGYVRMPDESLKGIDSAHDTPEIIRKALLATPDESLQAHDDELIEKCAKVATDACLVPPDGGTPMSYEVELCDAIAEVIRALKEVK